MMVLFQIESGFNLRAQCPGPLLHGRTELIRATCAGIRQTAPLI